MENGNKKVTKNHWSKTKVDSTIRKINNEIYKRNRQAPLQIKIDDLSIFINERITKRGIAKGMVFIQEDLNKNLLKIEKISLEVIFSSHLEFQYEKLKEIKKIIKIEIWSDIRFLMINKAITPGEVTELIKRQTEIDNDIDKWQDSIQRAISAQR